MSNLVQDGYYYLYEEFTRGDQVTAINRILNVDVNTLNKKDNATLHQKNKMMAVLSLTEKGALAEEDLHSLLDRAIHKYNHKIVEIVIDHVMKNNPSINLFTSLQAAISQQSSMMIETIIPHCGFSKPSDLYIPRDLVMKPGQQYKECVELLLKWNFAVHPDSYQDQNLIWVAVKNGYSQIVVQLLERGIDVDMVDPETGLNLLTTACLNEHHKIVENLLKHNASINLKISRNNKIFNDRLHFYDRLHALKYFLSLVNNKDDRLNTLKYFLSLVNNKDNLYDITCLHISVSNCDLMTTKIILKYNKKQIDSQKLIEVARIAVLNDDKETVSILLNHGLDVINPQGATILYQCLDSQFDRQVPGHLSSDLFYREKDLKYPIAKLLLEKGAGIHLQTPGNSFVFEALSNGHPKIAQLFLEHDADVQYVGPDGDTLLHLAVRKNAAELIKSLSHTDLNFDAVNQNGDTPLNIAVKNASFRMAYHLIKYGADVNRLDQNNQTPLTIAFNFLSYYRQKITKLKDLEDEAVQDKEYLLIGPFSNELDENRGIIKVLQRQIVKLSVAQLKVNNQDLNNIKPYYDVLLDVWYKLVNIPEFELKCQEEIENLKTKIIDKTTFYDLLTKHNRFLIRFINNEEFQKNLEQKIWDEKFPLYIDIIRNRFREVKIRYKLESPARAHFEKYISQQLTDECIAMVLSYFSVEELKMFVQNYETIDEKEKDKTEMEILFEYFSLIVFFISIFFFSLTTFLFR